MKTVAQRNLRGARLRGLTLDQVWLFAAVAFVALRVFLTPIPPHDFWWHAATGRLIAATGQIPTSDSFSYTQADAPFYNQSWLAQLLLFGLLQLGGPALVLLAQALILGGAYWLLVRLCLLRGAGPRLSAGLFLLATMPASFDNWVVRPQSYAIPLFIASLYLLTLWRDPEGRRQEPAAARRAWRYLLPLPLLAVVWVNLHGSFVLGGALIALTFLGELVARRVAAGAEARAWASRPVGRPEDLLERPAPPARPPLWHLVVAGGATGLAWLVNPGGLQVLGYVRNLLSSSQVTELVVEWAPPTIRDPNGALFFLFLIAGVVILAYAHRGPDLVDLLLAGAFLWLALGAVRNNIWFTAVATPLLARQLVAWRPAGAPARPAFQGLPALNGALVGLFGLALLLTLPWVKPWLDLPPVIGALVDEATPVAAVEALAATPDRPARLFHAMSHGSYLIWAAPEQKVWADPRIELYPLGQWLDYGRLSAGEGAEALLERYGVDGLLLDNTEQAGLVAWATERPDQWQLRFSDAATSYFVRAP